MTCDRCKHQADVRAGKYRNVAFKRTPCGKCHWHEPSSVATIAFDDARAAAVRVSGEEPFPEELPDTDLLPADVLADALVLLMRLRPETRDVVCLRARGLSYAKIARIQRTSVAAVERRHRRAMRLVPVLSAFFREKAVKLQRKKAGRKLRRTGAFGQANGVKQAVSGPRN